MRNSSQMKKQQDDDLPSLGPSFSLSFYLFNTQNQSSEEYNMI